MSALDDLRRRNDRNATLEVENASLTQENERLKKQVNFLRERNIDLKDGAIIEIVKDGVMVLKLALDGKPEDKDARITLAINALTSKLSDEKKDWIRNNPSDGYWG